MSFFGGIFSMLTLGLAMGAVTMGAVFFVYGRDLPSYETLAQYAPKTISRIYSGEGQIIDEFAAERRLFTPAEEIPELVKHAFVSAEDQNFYTHPGLISAASLRRRWRRCSHAGRISAARRPSRSR